MSRSTLRRVLIATAMLPIPAPGPSAEDRPAAPIAVFREPGFPASGAASNPETLAATFREAGLACDLVGVRELSDPGILRPDRVPLVVLPYGRSFPAGARDSFRAFLRAGGSFIALGGYAFRETMARDPEGRWVREEEVIARGIEEALRPERSLLRDGGFEEDATAAAPIDEATPDGGWRRSSDACRIATDGAAGGARCAEVISDARGSGEWRAAIRPAAGRLYRIRARVMTADVSGRGYAYLAVYQLDRQGGLVTFRDFAQPRGTTGWARHEHDIEPGAGVELLVVKAGIFDALGRARFDDIVLADVTGLRPTPMTTATGSPQDGLEVRPEQIGLFDADYRLRRVARLAAARDQTIFPEATVEGALEGWAATCVRGQSGIRWVSLLDTFDRYGRLRGSAAALVLHREGHWAGSSWAAFGVESADLLDGRHPELSRGLGRLARRMLRRVWLASLSTARPSCVPGTTATVTALVENRGTERALGELTLHLGEGRGSAAGEAAVVSIRPVELDPGATARLEVPIEVPPRANGLLTIGASLRIDGEPWDSVETGLVVLGAPAEVSPLVLEANYLRYGDRPIFLFGSDSYANVYTSAAHGPLLWEREIAAARDHGFQIHENLQYSSPGHVLADVDWSRFLGMAHLVRGAGMTFMPGILIGHDVAAPDEEIAAQSRQCREYAERLGGVPRLIWYVNGDYQLRHDHLPSLRRKWARFLRESHGDLGRLREAWSEEMPAVETALGHPPSDLDELPFPPPVSGRWDSRPSIDLARFHAKLVTDWNAAHVAAIRSVERARPITSEYYQIPFGGIDLRLTIDGQDLSNIGYFDEPHDDVDRLAARLRWNDLRAEGKSVGLGEYGVKTHPAWTVENGASGYHIVRTEDEQRELFLAVAHVAFGLGASRVQNWCLRDSDERVFPWGVFRPGPIVPKDIAHVHRNLGLLFRLFEPRYAAPPVTVLLCDHVRLGAHDRLGLRSGYRTFESLLSLGADFNVLGDLQAARVPEATRAIVYPAALVAEDASWDALLGWVERGGALLVSGGPVYGPERRLDRIDRVARAVGLRWVGRRYSPEERAGVRAPPARVAAASGLPPLGLAPIARWEAVDAEVLATDADGAPAVVRRKLGRGTVCFVADPLEFAEEPATLPDLRALHSWFLEGAGCTARPAAPAGPDLHVLAQATREGLVHVLYSLRRGTATRPVPLETRAGQIVLGVRDRRPALAAVDAEGRVRAIESRGPARIGADPVLDGDALVAVASLDGDDVRRSAALVVLPFGDGTEAAFSSRRAWIRPRVILGDFADGRFRELERLDPRAGQPPGAAVGATSFRIELDPDRASLVALICEEEESARWSDHLGLLMSDPGRVRGW